MMKTGPCNQKKNGRFSATLEIAGEGFELRPLGYEDGFIVARAVFSTV
jgi:hypothetical protein